MNHRMFYAIIFIITCTLNWVASIYIFLCTFLDMLAAQILLMLIEKY